MNVFKMKAYRLALIISSLFIFYLSAFSLESKQLDRLGQSMLKYLFTHQLILSNPDSSIKELVQIRDQLLSHESIHQLSCDAKVTDFIMFQDENYPAIKKGKLNCGFRLYAAALYLDYGFEKSSADIMRYLQVSFCQEENELKRKILLEPKSYADLLEWFGDALLEWHIAQKLFHEEWPDEGSWKNVLCSNLMIRMCAFPEIETMNNNKDKSTHDYGRDWEIKLGLKYFEKSLKSVKKNIHKYVERVQVYARQVSKSAQNKSELLVHLNKKMKNRKRKFERAGF